MICRLPPFPYFLGESFERMENNHGYLALMLLKRKKCNFLVPAPHVLWEVYTAPRGNVTILCAF